MVSAELLSVASWVPETSEAVDAVNISNEEEGLASWAVAVDARSVCDADTTLEGVDGAEVDSDAGGNEDVMNCCETVDDESADDSVDDPTDCRAINGVSTGDCDDEMKVGEPGEDKDKVD